MITIFISLLIGSLSLLPSTFAANEGSPYDIDYTFEVLRARSYIYQAVPNGVGTKVIGIIDFEQTGTLVKLNGSLSGLTPGLHGFHVHEKGDIGNGCLASAAHFNPHKMNHGAPSDANRHVGDLGNIETSTSSETVIRISDSVISLSGRNSILGRAVVVHEKADDLGRGGTPDSLKTGNAGARIACGVIGILDEIETFTTVAPLHDETSTNFGFLATSFPTFFLGILLVLRHN